MCRCVWRQCGGGMWEACVDVEAPVEVCVEACLHVEVCVEACVDVEA